MQAPHIRLKHVIGGFSTRSMAKRLRSTLADVHTQYQDLIYHHKAPRENNVGDALPRALTKIKQKSLMSHDTCPCEISAPFCRYIVTSPNNFL